MGAILDRDQKKILEIVESSARAAKNPMRFVREAVSQYALWQMNRSIAQCHACGFCGTRTLGRGNPNASLMVLMDYPDAKQVNQQDGVADVFDSFPAIEVFLKKLFEDYHVDMNDVYIMNSIACCPYREIEKQDGKKERIYRVPTTKEIRNCSTYTHYAIDVVHPSMILLMGNVALNLFKKEPISKARGKWISAHTIPAMPTYSPFHLSELKGQIDESERLTMCEDFKKDIGNTFKAFQNMWPNSNLFQTTKKDEV